MGRRRRRDEEFLHVKGIGTVGVKQVRRSDISFSDDSGDAGHRDLFRLALLTTADDIHPEVVGERAGRGQC